MDNGFAGKILVLNLTEETYETIDTAPYEEWIGGNGLGTKLWWDYTKNHRLTNPLDPDNANVVATGPIAGTPTPSGGGRCEMLGVGMQGYPKPWFTRSNIGGRFAPMMKYAGYDAIVITGKASRKVWVSIINDKVSFLPADDLWELDTQETQEKLMPQMYDDYHQGGWSEIGKMRDDGYTTQRPVILTIGPHAEKYGPLASVVCDAAHVAGQGGFGGVWAGKNLKAVGVLGNKDIGIADPQAMMEARMWAKNYTWGGHADHPNNYVGMQDISSPPGNSTRFYGDGVSSRPYGCVGCVRACRGRTSFYYGNEGMCIGFHWFTPYDKAAHNGAITTNTPKATTLLNRYGLNANSFMPMTFWIMRLLDKGILGKGKEIDSDLPFDKLGTYDFAKELLGAIVNNTDIGADLALGLQRCAEKWGRWESDSKSGLLPVVQYDYGHHYDPRTSADWGYASILSDRDINSHDLDFPCYWTPSQNYSRGREPDVSAETLAQIMGEKLVPFNDPEMIDYSDEGIYKRQCAKAVAWTLYYNRSWKNSVGYCDWAWTDLVNPYGEDYRGMTPTGEPLFYNAVTGDNKTFADMMWFGKRVYDLQRAIWQLETRTRDDEVFNDYIYEAPHNAKVPNTSYEIPYVLPCYDEKKDTWAYKNTSGRKLDRKKVEQVKSYFYQLEGCDTTHGWITRSTLEAEGLGFAADELEQAGCLGDESEMVPEQQAAYVAAHAPAKAVYPDSTKTPEMPKEQRGA